MPFPMSDTLEGIRDQPHDVQVALIVAAVQNLRAQVADVTNELKSVKRALYTVALTVTGSALIFALSIAMAFR